MYNLENPDYKGIAEYQVFKRLLNTYPTGILSVVSDTFDLFKVITEYLPRLKQEILARNGKLVIRPDSGDPVDILCGIDDFKQDEDGTMYKVVYTSGMFRDRGRKISSAEQKGVIELLWNVFGGTINEQGYKVLDPHIGAIYGDSITIERADEICARLEAKGFASTNIVLGIGSFTYQYNTRDTFGFAMKATYVEIKHWDVATERLNGTMGKNANPEWVEGREIFKNPITDDGTKKSATGLLSVVSVDDEIRLVDRVNWETESNNSMLKTLYVDGQFKNTKTLTEIRNNLVNSEKSVTFVD